jgi:hypothetical protein
MIKIKFSHKYVKNSDVGNRPTYLIGVSKCDISKLPRDFLFWDTMYVDNMKDGAGFYKLPKRGDFILLTLCTPDSYNDEAHPFHIWTTLRRWLKSKEDFYKKHIGEQVEIFIEEGKL